MKAANKILILLVLLPAFLLAQHSSKTLSNNFNVEGIQFVEFDLPGTVEVVHWDSQKMKVDYTLEINSDRAQLIKALVEAGRYRFEQERNGDHLVIRIPNMNKPVTISNKTLEEELSFTFYVPKKVEAIYNAETLAANDKK